MKILGNYMNDEYNAKIPKIYDNLKKKIKGVSNGSEFLHRLSSEYTDFDSFMNEQVHCQIERGYLTGQDGKRKKIHWDFIGGEFYTKDGTKFNHLDYLNKRDKAIKKVVNGLMKKMSPENTNNYKEKNVQVRMNLEKYSAGLLDFHNHSTASDGGDTPTQLVERAKRHGVSAMALTDHHNHRGLEEFLFACKKYDILGIPYGVEISAELPDEVLTPQDMSSPDLVILGKKPNLGPMKRYQDIYMRDLEERHVPEVLAGLESVGFEFPQIDIKKECASFHIPPDILHSFPNYKNNMEVLKRYVKTKDPSAKDEDIESKPTRFCNRWLFAVGMPAYTARFKGFTFTDAVDLAKEMNCILSIAHPGGEYGFLTDAMLNYMIANGAQGIGIRNYFNTEAQNKKFDKLAKQHNLIRTGGSDCHGDKGPFKIGMYDRPQNQLPKDVLEELWERLPS